MLSEDEARKTWTREPDGWEQVVELSPEPGLLSVMLLTLLLGLRRIWLTTLLAGLATLMALGHFLGGLRGCAIHKNEKENGEYELSPLTQQLNK